MHFSIFLLTLFPLAAWCSPNPQGGPPSTLSTSTTSSLSSSSSPASLPTPPPANPAPPGGIKQEVIRANFMNNDGKNVSTSATVEFKCNPTLSSPLLKDTETLSAHYVTKPIPPISIPKGGANTCVPLEKDGASAAKLEACGNDVKLMYTEVGKLLQKFQSTCVKTIDGSQRVGGTMDFVANGKTVISIKVNKG